MSRKPGKDVGAPLAAPGTDPADAPATDPVEGPTPEPAPPTGAASSAPTDSVTVFLTDDSPMDSYTDDQTHLIITREPREVAQAEIGENTRRQTWVKIEPFDGAQDKEN